MIKNFELWTFEIYCLTDDIRRHPRRMAKLDHISYITNRNSWTWMWNEHDEIHVRNESTKRVRIQMTSMQCPPRALPVRTHYHPHGLQARDKLCPGPHLNNGFEWWVCHVLLKLRLWEHITTLLGHRHAINCVLDDISRTAGKEKDRNMILCLAGLNL